MNREIMDNLHVELNFNLSKEKERRESNTTAKKEHNEVGKKY
jgi:hypothetical protein